MKLASKNVTAAHDCRHTTIICRGGDQVFLGFWDKRITMNEIEIRKVRYPFKQHIIFPVADVIPANVWNAQLAAYRIQSMNFSRNKT